MQFEIGVNMEFIRSEDKSFEDGVRRAADLGYQWGGAHGAQRPGIAQRSWIFSFFLDGQ